MKDVEKMKLTVLGYWGAYPWQHEGTSSYLLQTADFSLLIDAGSHTLSVLEDHLDPLTLDSVIISHYHHDHIADLGVLQYYRQLRGTSETPVLPIYGHGEDDAHFASLTLANVSKGYQYQEEDTLTIGPFTVTFMRTKHPVPCFAMRIVEDRTKKTVVYTADSGYLSAFESFVTQADVLITDAYFLEGNENHPVHFTAKEVGKLASQGNVKTLVLSHLQQELDLSQLENQARHYAGPNVDVLLAQKNLTIEI